MLEKQVYSCWAFSDNENEKAQINKEIYEEIKDKAIVSYLRGDYGHKLYTVMPKEGTKLSVDEMALIADKGNLCFGYGVMGRVGATGYGIKIFTD